MIIMKTKRLILGTVILIVSVFILANSVYAENVVKQKQKQYDSPPPFAPDQVIVSFKPGTPGDAKRSAHAQTGGRVIDTHAIFNADLVSIPKGLVHQKIAAYKLNPNVRYAEPNYYRTLSTPPNEGYDDFVCNGNYWKEQWYMHNTGQDLLNPDTAECTTNGAPDADIDWLEAWESGVHGQTTIKIAVIDTGIEATHPDLASKISEVWVANGITEGTGDLVGHGTHVAGIAAAETNNGRGISGVGINAVVGSLKGCYSDLIYGGICEDWDTAEAIEYAANNGYHIINMSFGGPEVENFFKEAVEYAFIKGVILVSSAGNEYYFEKPNQSYPASLPWVVSVAATDHYDNLASFSNFGQWVDIAAPGVNILSTYPEAGCCNFWTGSCDPDCYNWLSGTSMASPVVAGAAALVLDKLVGANPVSGSDDFRLTYRDAVINTLLDNADHTGALGQNMLAWTRNGRLNINAALNDTGSTDNDGDGFTDDVDCDDSNASVYPGAEEIADGIDNNCNGQIDEGFYTYYQDLDKDNYGNPSVTIIAKFPPDGYVSDNNDCDDNNDKINPGVSEICDDDVDNDCDGDTDFLDSDCCKPKKAECSFDDECCSGDCLPKGVCK